MKNLATSSKLHAFLSPQTSLSLEILVLRYQSKPVPRTLGLGEKLSPCLLSLQTIHMLSGHLQNLLNILATPCTLQPFKVSFLHINKADLSNQFFH